MTKTIENEILVRRVNIFCNENKEIKASKSCISALDLINILKDYYQELYDIFDEESELYQELLDEINSLISPDYVSVLKRRNSSFSFNQIRLIVKDSLGKIIDQNYNLRGIKCDKIKVAICQNVSAIKLDIHDNYELKPIVVCRDIDAGQLHLAKNSNNNEKLLEQIRGKLVNIFDVIDSFRATMPIPKEEDIIDDRIFSDETVDNDNKYIIEFDEELFKGKVVVLANGNVNFSLLLCVDDQEYELSKTIRVDEIMSKIPIDVSELKDPIKSIVYASFEKEYAIVNGEVKAI